MRFNQTKLIRLAGVMARPIKVLELSTQTYNALSRWGMKTVADIVTATITKDGTDYVELMKVRGIGKKAVAEIQHNMDNYLHPYIEDLHEHD